MRFHIDHLLLLHLHILDHILNPSLHCTNHIILLDYHNYYSLILLQILMGILDLIHNILPRERPIDCLFDNLALANPLLYRG